MRTLRIGAGAGFSGDRIEPAVELARRGELDYLVFECLAERTIALAQQARLGDPEAEFDPMLDCRMQAVLPVSTARRVRIVSNMGAANPRSAARRVCAIARELGIRGLRVAAVTGDDVLTQIREGAFVLEETGRPATDLGDALISANTYVGAAPIVEALGRGADVLICGRVSDPALFLAPLVYHFGWAFDDWRSLGQGTLVGHLLECAAKVSGGYFADPGMKDVPDLAHIGFLLAEVAEDGDAVIVKLAGSGGMVTRATCTEQLLYEIHDPSHYMQPDVVADFPGVTIDEIGPDRVAVGSATGRPATGRLKVSVGYLDGWIGEGQISYAGPGAVVRGRLAGELVAARLAEFGPQPLEARTDLIGVDAILPETGGVRSDPREVCLRVATRCQSHADAERVAQEVESLYPCGPAGGGGVTSHVRQVIGIASTFLPADLVIPQIEILES